MSNIACDLTALDAMQRRRRDELQLELRELVEERQGLPDGLAFRFAGEERTLSCVAEFIALERLCCPFIHFEIDIAAEKGSLWVRMRGKAGVKEFLLALASNDKAWP